MRVPVEASPPVGPSLVLHASALVVGECGILLRGASGAGKSRLALATVAEANRDGRFARLVADDRTLLAVHHGRLVARPHQALAGRVERRGLGLTAVPHEPACVLRLVADLCEGWPARLPTPEDSTVAVAGIALPPRRVRGLRDAAMSTTDAAALILSALDAPAMRG